jgi:hypothetical protein
MENAVSKSALYITDDELRERGVSELEIDDFDRHPETQKFANFSRDREAVEAALAARLNHEQR